MVLGYKAARVCWRGANRDDALLGFVYGLTHVSTINLFLATGVGLEVHPCIHIL